MKRFPGKLLLLTVCMLLLSSAVLAEGTHTHQYVIVSEKSVAPSCTSPGSTYYECAGCGDHYTVEIPEVGHKPGYTEVTVTQSPDCMTTGVQVTTVYCKHCDSLISQTTAILPKTDHTWPSSWTVVQQATCTENGLQVKNCTVCGTLLASEIIPALGHSWGSWTTVQATCEVGGYEYRVCGRDSSHIETRSQTAALGHQWDSGKVTTQPGCVTAGVRTYTCLRDPSHTYTQSIPATGHSWGEYTLTTPPTCTSAGVETSVCSVCKEERTRTVPATGHIWDSGVITSEPGCVTTGIRTYTCLNDPSHTYMETIAAVGHKWTKWDVDKTPTCTEKGHRSHKCEVCGKTYDETIQPLGHQWGEWILVREATALLPGLEQRTCARCGKVEEREVPFEGGGATMCVFGPRLKDVGTYLDPSSSKWYMFTPFDASVEGRQTYELVVDDTYIVGTATIIVENGTVSLEYELYTDSLQVDLEFFTFLPDMHVLNQYEPEDLKPICGMETGVPYSIADRFGGDTNLVLYFCSRVTYSYDPNGMSPLNYMSTYHQALLSNMLLIMD